jgi:O-antigen ligase
MVASHWAGTKIKNKRPFGDYIPIPISYNFRIEMSLFTTDALRDKAGRFTCLVLLPGLALVLPFSTALTVFFGNLAFVLGLFAIRWRSFFQAFLASPFEGHFRLITSLIAFLLYLCVNAFFYSDLFSAFYAIGKYKKIFLLLIISILIVQSFKKDRLVYVLDWFLLGTLAVAMVGIASHYGILTWLFGEPHKEIGGWFIGSSQESYVMRIGGPDNPTVGRNHITQGAFTAFAVVYCWWRSCTNEAKLSTKTKHLMWALSAPLTLYAFLLQGRTGYVLMFVALIFLLYKGAYRLALQLIKRTQRFTAVALGFVIITGTLVGLMSIIPTEQVISRSTQAINETVLFFQEGATTDGQQVRLDLWRTALGHFASAPVFGTGVGSNVVFSSGTRQVFQPHSEALLILSTMGVVGLLLFANILRNVFAMCHGDSHLKLLLYLYLLDGCFNSVLWDLAEGHYFILLTLVILGYTLQRGGEARGVSVSVT